MERLLEVSERKIDRTGIGFLRELFPKAEWNLPLIIIKGPRGSGKTTYLLQRAKSLIKQNRKLLYCTLDHPYFEVNRLYDLAEELNKRKIRYLFLDEVHKYANWSKDLKAIHDNIPDMKVVATGSSILDIMQGEFDLSRRAASYYLPCLSFREYLKLKGIGDYKPLDLNKILSNHYSICSQISDEIPVLTHFKAYLTHGCYPFFKESLQQYPIRLLQTINTVLENDIPAFENVDYQTVRNLKKLLYFLSKSVPYTPNITELAGKVGTSRPHLLKMLDFMERGDVIMQLHSASKGILRMTKPEKIFLHNTNLAFILGDYKPEMGKLRETFFFNQLKTFHQVTAPKFGDFMVDGTFVFEIGGPSKTDKQIKGIPNSYIVSDSIATGGGSQIPLWVFGFMY